MIWFYTKTLCAFISVSGGLVFFFCPVLRMSIFDVRAGTGENGRKSSPTEL
jgi:hypothetical protein